MTRPGARPDQLPGIARLLAVVAHPDDESFGLGAVLAELVSGGTDVSLLCFTHGEASTLRDAPPGDLATVRSLELHRASKVLGLRRVELHNYPDGRLATVSLEELTGHVLRLIDQERPSHLLAFDTGGVSGHPDHHRATLAALAAGRAVGLPVLAWALPAYLADRLNAEWGTSFTGRDPAALHVRLTVSRYRQTRAIACHRSQSTVNPVLHRRLELLGDREYLRMIHLPSQGDTGMSYGLTVRLPAPFAGTVQRVRDALAAQGFGVLTEIDVQATMRAKLGAEMEEYLILGACNPPLAHRALTAERDIGLLLPCNVVVRADGPDATVVQALDPAVMARLTARPEVAEVAAEATDRLRAALDTLTGQPA